MQYITQSDNRENGRLQSHSEASRLAVQLKTEQHDIEPKTRVNGSPCSLPYLATSGDVREVVQFLKRKPEGASLAEAMDALRKRLFDPRKVFAYEFWGIVTREDDRLHLSSLGWEFAEQLVPEAEAFRSVIARTPLYHGSLVWIHNQAYQVVTHLDMGTLWRQNEHKIDDEGKLESHASSFFHLCHAADIGMLTVGRKGQPTRLRIYPEELERYLKGAPQVKEEEDSPGSHRSIAFRQALRQPSQWSTSSGAPRVLVSHSGDAKTVERLLDMLELIGVAVEVIERNPKKSLPVSDQTRQAIQRCNIGVFLLCEEDLDETQDNMRANSFLIEVGAAFVHFDQRIILMLKGDRPLPPNLQQLHACSYGTDLTWEGAVQLARKIRDISQQNLSAG